MMEKARLVAFSVLHVAEPSDMGLCFVAMLGELMGYQKRW